MAEISPVSIPQLRDANVDVTNIADWVNLPANAPNPSGSGPAGTITLRSGLVVRTLNNMLQTLIADAMVVVQGKVDEAQHWADQASAIATSESFLVPGTTTARNLSERFSDFVNIKDFGAAGDGVTDDTAAIQKAMNHGSNVYFPWGSYVCTVLPDFTKCWGEGVLISNGSFLPIGDIVSPVSIMFPDTFSSFAEIFNYLQLRNISDTVTIFVKAGTYDLTEEITHDSPYGMFFQIIGEGSSNTILRFSLPAASRKAGIRLYEAALGLVDKLTLDGNDRYGFTGGDPVTSDGLATDPVGVFANRNSYANLGADVVVRNFARNGIFAVYGSTINAASVTVEGTGSDAVVASQNGSISANNATIKNMYGAGIYADYGGMVWTADSNIDTVHARNGVGGFGIGCAYGGVVYAPNSNIKNCAQKGITATYGSVVYASGSIVANSVIGAEAYYQGVIQLNNAVITDNIAYGIHASGGGAVYAAGSTISNSGNHGIFAQRDGKVFANNATSKDNAGSGFLCISGYIDATNANAVNNMKNGIQVMADGSVIASGVNCSNNGIDGVLTTNGGVVYIEQTPTIKNNTGYGIRAYYDGQVYAGTISMAGNVSGNIAGDVSGTVDATTGQAVSKIYIKP